ncbi:putative F-box protein PP2-B12 [Apium graveolens]|uniref:putative F-box protein PP2-B12 n=1 Tax=Apium graveolens TaxID=4045 RepID=UPI003D79AA35
MKNPSLLMLLLPCTLKGSCSKRPPMRGDTKGMNALPQDLIEEIVSRTSPAHTCGKLSLLSKSFRSAAESNNVWERFLPLDIISRRTVQNQRWYNDPWKQIGSDTLRHFPAKKDLYFFLCDNPLYIDNGAMYIWLDKLSGNKCFHIGPMSLTLGHLDGWKNSWLCKAQRFNRVPGLEQNLEIEGKISTSLLSQNTTYTAYLLFDFTTSCWFKGFRKIELLETFVGIDGYGESDNRRVNIPAHRLKYDKPAEFIGPLVLRKDGLYELELGNYLNKQGGENRELRMRLREVRNKDSKGGILVLGIEIRPSSSMKTS